MSSKLLRGTFILTLGTFISKFLGLFYVIPFYQIVGSEGTILYNYSYVPYTIFISIATAGVPLAVSKFISKYNALEEYAVGRKLFKSGIIIMLASGIVCFLIMYLGATTLAAAFTSVDDPEKLQDIATVIKAVSFALIIIPFMSLIRGYFQGHQSMGPSAVSQVVEQLIRIMFLLAGAFIVMNVMNGSLVTAVSVATFAAFIGGLGSLFVLFWYWYKRKPYMDELLEQDKGTIDISLKEMYKEIIVYSIPFVLVGIANPLFQLIDLLTFNRAMDSMGIPIEESEIALSILNYQTHKLVIIPVTLAIAFSMTLVPSITKAFVEEDRLSMKRQLNQTFQVVLFLTLPAAVGLALLAEPIYTLFYEYDVLGADVLRAYAPVAMLFALYSVTAAILQGINEQRFTMLSLLFGILVKLSLNIPLIKWMETEGAILATALGYGAAILINLIVIKIFSGYQFRLVVRRGLLIIIFTAIMLAVTAAMYKLITLFLSPESNIQSIFIVVICAAAGAGIYFYLAYKSKLVFFLFGDRVDNLLRKLKLKRA
ncbi:putative polysaccharide biosynthesis protein [Cytobacillus purgationiresistens]|uniref:O-antigen/teichoic acid export membrane protein n=1 Tax=Cytobacillus purgationiresistens TaxID=863449 RepID=A0ABU0ALV3_9BACI|nr:polysaccharide biosynthesis protein [Cytobacillus purgationiresistens]MDQ0272247.1 O-antigen/teichoic acid export membrane protein [Cytobacillus purgationiresistens]